MRNYTLLFLGLFFFNGLAAQQYYVKEIQAPAPKNGVQVAATAEGGFIVLDEWNNDSIFFQLFKYDTCGELVWQRVFRDSNLAELSQLHIAINPSNTMYIVGRAVHKNSGDTAIALTIIPQDLSIAPTLYYNLGAPSLQIDQLLLSDFGDLYLTATYSTPTRTSTLLKIKNDGQLMWTRGLPDTYQAHLTPVESNNILLTCNTVDSSLLVAKFQPDGTPAWIKMLEDSIVNASNPVYALGAYYVVVQKAQPPLSGNNYPYDRKILSFDVDGVLLRSGERFTGRGQGLLSGNDQNIIYVQYDSILQDGVNALTFSVFHPSGSIAAQFYYDDFEDTLLYSYDAPAFVILPAIGSDDVTFALSNYAQVNDTTYMHYIGKAAAPLFQFGMGCQTPTYFQKDTVIPEPQMKDYPNAPLDIPLALSDADTLQALDTLLEDQTVCMISPQSAETPEFHCTGETVIFVDTRLGKTVQIIRDTTVINDQFLFCGNTITYSTKYIFTTPTPSFAFPKAFTPNGDNLNDNFGLVADSTQNIAFSTYQFSIFNRWGEKVFETEDPLSRWNGNFKGKPAPTGVYLYIVRYEGKMNGTCDISGVQRGDITLLK